MHHASTFVLDANPCNTMSNTNTPYVEDKISVFHTQFCQMTFTALEVAPEIALVDRMKRPVGLDIPAVGGHSDDYWEVVMGDEIVRIPKARDPIADLRDLIQSTTTGSVEEELSEIRRAISDRAALHIGDPS